MALLIIETKVSDMLVVNLTNDKTVHDRHAYTRIYKHVRL